MRTIYYRSFALLIIFAFLSPATLAASASVSTVVEFDQTWGRTDGPVADLRVDRTWMWGPRPFTEPLAESYTEAPDGMRAVQYFDKSRMEITDPNADAGSIWYVTTGLLSSELITGRMQMGDNAFEQREPAQVNVAGDFNDADGPTYATFNGLLDAPPAAMNQTITERVDRYGQVLQDAALAERGVTIAHIDEVTNHAIARPFWEFMNSRGMVYQGGVIASAPLFQNPFFATGRPVSEPYWANVKVAETYRDVLIQCFERRCLTYTPDNPLNWRVEAGNVGQHYYMWRYNAPVPAPPPLPAPRPVPPPPPVAQAAPPGVLSIPKIGVSAPVEYVGQDSQGRMGVPVNYWNVAWYQPGTVPGQPGNAVVAGHVDSAQLGPVVFWNLRNLVPGDYVYVTATDGTELTFRVTDVATYPVDNAPLQRIFGPTNARNLNLITCEGIFDPTARDYDQRRVVYTTLVD
jgi:LPXTG-site transpeptidase (sortase) family protein